MMTMTDDRPAQVEMIYNGRSMGGMAQNLLNVGFDPYCLKPFIGNDGRSYVNIQNGLDPKTGRMTYKPLLLTNAYATLRKDQWIRLDTAVIRAAKPRLQAWTDLNNASPYNLGNGLAVTSIEHERMSDITPATISMNGLRRSEGDRPVFDRVSIPVPIIHKDFTIDARTLLVSETRNTPLNTSMAALCGRRVAEEAEKLVLGLSSYSYAGGTIQGYTNFSSRLLKTITAPTAGGWTPNTLLDELLAAKTLSQDAYHFGPWKVYCATAWDKYMDGDFSAAKGNNTLRERIGQIQKFSQPVTLDYLTNYDILLVQMTEEVAQAVTGMDIQTVQWETNGGFEFNFKVMAIWFPRLFADINGKTGIVHCSV